MPLRRRLAGLPLALLIVLLVAAPALAQTLTDRVVDESGVMSDEQRDEALERITALEDEHNVQLWALFVGTTSGQEITDFATAVAAENGLGGNDALLVVAVDDRRDALWLGDLLGDVSDEEVDRILAEEVEPRLQDGNWGAAIGAAADALGDAVAGASEPEPAPEPDPGGQPAPGSGDEGGLNLVPIIAIGLIGVGLWLVWSRWQRGSAVAAEDRERDRRLTQLAQQANARLIETDELLRHNGQELGFAEAEFGADAAEPFREALAAARADLQEAFRTRQRLDDGTPEEPAERERMLNEILALCDRARERVESQTEKFRELRDLERRAPEVLAEVQRRVDSVTARIPAVEAAIATLVADASGSSRAVHGNVTEAQKRIALAARGAVDGRQALERGDRPAAARAAKATQDALEQAVGLLDAVDHEAAVLDEARAGLDAALARARTDLAAAEAAVEGATDDDQADELAEARSKLAAAEEAMAGAPRDVVLAYRLAREAEAAADGVVARVNEGEERLARERAGAVAAIRAAELSADRAAEFIAGRHHGVGRRARTALSEADAALERARALADHDPRAAVAEAQRAGQLADAAYSRARADFDQVDDAGYGGTVVIGGQPFPMGRRSGWGQDVGGAIIGGIIGSILSGGGRRGGWGGGFGGGGFGGGGFGGFGGGGGGFGGGRSFGGGFGGGGGRARGGGW